MLHTALAGHRLVTLTGPGGCGKTRLANELAASCDGHVTLVELAPRDAEGVIVAVAEALGTQPTEDDLDIGHLVALAKTYDGLIVLDNCEHVVASAAAVAAALVARCPHLRVLATSREPLRLSGERVVPVGPLSEPDAVELFCVRAADVGAEVRATPQVSALCRRLDHLALAVELAAVRCRASTIEEIDVALADRFSVLVSDTRDVDPRHRTLRSTIAWSVDLLPVDAAQVLQGISVFAGPFTAAAAKAVAGATVDDLVELVDRSLLVADRSSTTTRFRLLDSIAEYARELLDASPDRAAERRLRLVRWALQLSAIAGELDGRGEAHALGVLDADAANLWEAATTTDAGLEGLQLTTQLSPYWMRRGHARAGRDALIAATEGAPRPDDQAVEGVWAEAHLALGDLSLALSRLDEAEAAYMAAEPRRPALAQAGRGRVLRRRADYVEAATQLSTALVGAREEGDLRLAALCLLELGQIDSLTGRVDDAQAKLDSSLAIRRELGDRRGALACLNSTGKAAEVAGRYDVAAAYYAEALDAAQQLDDVPATAAALSHLGDVSYRRAGDVGDLHDAEDRYRESLELYRRVGDRRGEAGSLAGLGNIAYRRNLLDLAAERYEESLAIRRDLGDRRGEASALASLANLHAMAANIGAAWVAGEEALRLQRAVGDERELLRTMFVMVEVARDADDVGQAMRYAEAAHDLAVRGGLPRDVATAKYLMGQLSAVLGERDRARVLLIEAATTACAHGEHHVLARALEAVAPDLVHPDPETATLLLGAAEALRRNPPFSANIRAALRPAYDAVVAAARAPLGPDFEATWHRGRALSADAALGLLEQTRYEGITAWRQEGAVWMLTYDGATFAVPDRKGMAYLEKLVERPGESLSSWELGSVGGAPDARGLELSDRAAVTAYRRKVAELRSEADEARTWNDDERAARLDAEVERVIGELGSVTDLRGRLRVASSDRERVRKAVTKCIRDAIEVIRLSSPELAAHLDATVDTGSHCRYSPSSR